jgi:hypothetical protein
MNPFVSLGLLFAVAVGLVDSAQFGTYLDENCSKPITELYAFADVCTWGTDSYSGAFALTLSQCSDEYLDVNIYNTSTAPTCEGTPVFNFTVTPQCTQVQDFYVQAQNTSCQSEGLAYNVLAHFTPNCSDGGAPFTFLAGASPCAGNSFLPYLLGWDTAAFYEDPEYMFQVFNSTNGTCQDSRAIFRTQTFPAMCLKPTKPFNNIALDIYNAFSTIY